jgi:hypothetical protein
VLMVSPQNVLSVKSVTMRIMLKAFLFKLSSPFP